MVNGDCLGVGAGKTSFIRSLSVVKAKALKEKTKRNKLKNIMVHTGRKY